MGKRRKKIQETEPDSWKRDCYDWLQMLTFVLVAVVLVFTFLGMVIGVSGTSMYPTLHHQDIMVIQRIGYTPAQGDVVVLRKDSFLEEAIVKRVIAVEGQEVEIDYDNNTVYVDGVALDEPYIREPMGVPYTPSAYDSTGVQTHWEVPEGSIFVMGDNRNKSTDSRDARLGAIDEDYVLGKVVCGLWPPSKIGPL